ncbi:hypothetical protein Malapachy_1315 [Malassezia pachydermatis]|uniref:Uncharacterized protein n=1 Tax=Malassezia pachydermatis TaxID=77020 RepID=A0A0M8MJC0_9BASI|nr:hypothetical protein Malapachy_1315 [Malassezia pachydermatis]KOS12698.1 hypothetical protein Malapachy_1315 [Malassezia pachydermatis]
MEELIGYALYLYTHTYGSLPSHPDIQDNLDLVTITQSWVLRMVEDGMVDYDYPAIEYNLTVGRFGEDEFALCPKTLPKCMYASVADLTKVSIPSVPASSSGLKLSPSNEPTVSLAIMVVPTASGNTQIQVRPDTTTAEVLAAVCQQCHLEHPQNYALLRRDRGELIDMQLKAADFQHVDDLALVERTSMQAQALSNDLGPVLQQPKYKNAMDLITNYKSYAVNRRHHIAMGRQERILTLDGDWIHILRPTEKRLSHSKTTSYHVSSIMRCELNPRIPTQFRIVAYRERSRDTKRYEFETDDKDRAAEIVHEINHLLQQ